MNRQQKHLIRSTKDSIDRLENTIDTLETALDKAIDLLYRGYGNECASPIWLDKDNCTRDLTREEWKKWLFNE